MNIGESLAAAKYGYFSWTISHFKKAHHNFIHLTLPNSAPANRGSHNGVYTRSYMVQSTRSPSITIHPDSAKWFVWEPGVKFRQSSQRNLEPITNMFEPTAQISDSIWLPGAVVCQSFRAALSAAYSVACFLAASHTDNANSTRIP